MQTLQAIQVSEVECDPDLKTTKDNVAGQVAPSSLKTYASDLRHFVYWIADHDLTLQSLSRDDLVTYSIYLGETYAKAIASCMWAVVRRLLDSCRGR